MPSDSSAESRHLLLCRLAVDGLAGVLDRTLERLRLLADDPLVGSNCTFRSHAEGVGLDAHVGCEFALALCGVVISDRSIEILVANVIGRLGGGMASLGDDAGVELAGAVRGPDVGADDALVADEMRTALAAN